MIDTKKVLAITPARGGSKGIPRKNIRMIAGKPLLAWTIEHALKSTYIDRYIVSTEDREIKDIAIKYGAEVIDRPQELAQDNTLTKDVAMHVCKEMDNTFKADIIVLLQCTSPIRRPDLIDDCIEKFVGEKSDSLLTGYESKIYPHSETSETRRQDVNGFFVTSGNIYIMKANLLRKGDLFGKKISYYYPKREENIDIDDMFDFWVAEKVLIEKRI
jgi:N-acylneuraminate cytidylyltransferase